MQVLKKPQCYTKHTERPFKVKLSWSAFDSTGVVGSACHICKQIFQ